MISAHVIWSGNHVCVSCSTQGSTMFRVGFGKETKAYQKAGFLCKDCLIDLKNKIMAALVAEWAGGEKILAKKAREDCDDCQGTGWPIVPIEPCHCTKTGTNK